MITPSKEGRDLLGRDGPCLVNEVNLFDCDLGWVDDSRDQGIYVHRVGDELRYFLTPVGQTHPNRLYILGDPCDRPVGAAVVVPASVPIDLVAGPQRRTAVAPLGPVAVSCKDPDGRHLVGPAARFDDQFPTITFEGAAFSNSAHAARVPRPTRLVRQP